MLGYIEHSVVVSINTIVYLIALYVQFAICPIYVRKMKLNRMARHLTE